VSDYKDVIIDWKDGNVIISDPGQKVKNQLDEIDER
jgi:hypothetical protein